MANLQKNSSIRSAEQLCDASNEFAMSAARQYLSICRPTMIAAYVDYNRDLAIENDRRVKIGMPTLRQLGRTTFEKRLKALSSFDKLAARYGFEEVRRVRPTWVGAIIATEVAFDNGSSFWSAAFKDAIKKLQERR